MEKEQNTNSESQNNDAEEIKAEELNIKTQSLTLLIYLKPNNT